MAVTAITPTVGQRNSGVEETDAGGQLVERRESLRPDELPRIEPEAVAGHGQPSVEPVGVVARPARPARDRPARHHRSDGGEREVPQLLPDEGRPAEAMAAEWVDVEHEQGHRERHRDGLRAERRREGHEGCREPSAGECVLPCRPLEVGEHRQEIEETAEQVSPLRDPRDRLHAKRVERPQKGRGGGAQGDGHAAFRLVRPVIAALTLRVPVRSGRDRGDRQESARDEEEKRRVRRVEQEIAQVIAPRIHAAERIVEPEGSAT